MGPAMDPPLDNKCTLTPKLLRSLIRLSKEIPLWELKSLCKCVSVCTLSPCKHNRDAVESYWCSGGVRGSQQNYNGCIIIPTLLLFAGQRSCNNVILLFTFTAFWFKDSLVVEPERVVPDWVGARLAGQSMSVAVGNNLGWLRMNF